MKATIWIITTQMKESSYKGCSLKTDELSEEERVKVEAEDRARYFQVFHDIATTRIQKQNKLVHLQGLNTVVYSVTEVVVDSYAIPDKI